MKELIELDQKDIEAALAEYFAKKKDWFRVKVTLTIAGLTADGQGYIRAIVEKGPDPDVDPY